MAFQDHISQEMAFQLPLSSTASAGPAWLSNAVLRRNDDVLGLNRSEKSDNNNGRGGGGSEEELMDGDGGGGDDWERAKCKAEILGHPLYEQLLAAHVACLRIATPVDQLSRIDAQLSQSQQVLAKYSVLGNAQVVDEKELDQFMVSLLF